MDNNPVAPFDMYSDEVILWMEKMKKEKQTVKSCILISLLISFFVLGGITLFLFLFLIRNVNFYVSIAIPFIVLWMPLIISFAVSFNMHNVNLLYYVTNYRLIEFRDDKSLKLRYGYISDLKDLKICTYSDDIVSLEFEWNDPKPNYYYCYGFNNIDNAKEIYDIINNQKSKIDNMICDFETIPQ